MHHMKGNQFITPVPV